MQNWKKLGLIYNKQNYNAVPLALFVSPNIIRIFFSTRDSKNRSIPIAIDFDLARKEIIGEHTLNIKLGRKGTFDKHGIMPTSLLEKDGKLFMYYIGWNLGVSVPFRNAIGLLISEDNGLTFQKFSEEPLLDRGIYDNCFVASNCVLKDNEIYRMYYLSCSKWTQLADGKFQHHYNIKYAESDDAINWKREGKVAIDFKYKNEYAISTPRVIKENNIYKMWYSYRGSLRSDQYRIGYAESEDSLKWERKDELVNLDISKIGWDSEMICYPFIFDFEEKRFMLYNGNNYGKSGFGLAVCQRLKL